jgi:hypothetical protein
LVLDVVAHGEIEVYTSIATKQEISEERQKINIGFEFFEVDENQENLTRYNRGTSVAKCSYLCSYSNAFDTKLKAPGAGKKLVLFLSTFYPNKEEAKFKMRLFYKQTQGSMTMSQLWPK